MSCQKNRQSEILEEETEPKVKKPVLNVGFRENEERVYEFKILLPNGCTVTLKFRESTIPLSVQELIKRVKNKYLRLRSESQISKTKREVDWDGELYFLDEYDSKFRNNMDLRRFKANKTYILRLHDGQKEADVYESMWDLTPDIQLLNELPEEYTFETALAVLIMNKQTHQSSGKNRQSGILEEETEPKAKKPVLNVGFRENEEMVYEFKILLPNGCTVTLKFRESTIPLLVQELIKRVKNKYLRLRSESQISKAKREVDWDGELYFLDEYDNKFRNNMDLRRFKANKTYILRLQDGQKEADVYESMWDLTPDIQLLNELPEEYTFETALADLIDNSLQAVWYNHENNMRRLISVEVREDKISIFDTGRGMDSSEENSLVKWGKMGASLHRLSKKNAIRGKPPYLMPAYVSFSVLIDKKVIFSKEFQIGRRQLRAEMIPEKCVAGSQLENVVFEIVNSRGKVDINIHDEEKFGQSHTLTLKSESNDIDDSIKYTFSHGRCIVRSIQLPDKEGIFSFVAFHSHYSDLQLAIKVHLEAIPVIDCQPLSFERISLPFPYSPGLRNPKLEYGEVRHQSPDDRTLHFLGSLASADVGTFLGSFVNEQKKHEAGVKSCGLSIRELEEKLEDLETQKEAIKQDLSELQVARKLVLSDGTHGSAEKELIMERIRSRTNCAAAVVSKMIKDISDQDLDNVFKEHIIGVVALLGTVQSIKLSRILAEYLGDEILAIVCKTNDDIAFLERHDKDGNLDHDSLLHQYATKLGKTINGRYLVLCLEKIRPYPRVCLEDPQRMLELPDPALPDGSLPAGFLGYAVNMIHLNAEHLHTKTDAGDGLRETLFYRLFGNLQVYEDRESMKMASPCAEHGAISLDGGIMRGNGVISLGSREPDVLFPVVSAQNQVLSPHEMEVMLLYKEKKLKLSETIADIGKVNKTLRRVKSKFEKRKDEYNKFMEENAPFIGSL